MKQEPKPDESVAIQQNSDDVNLRISYDINSARNMYAIYAPPASGQPLTVCHSTLSQELNCYGKINLNPFTLTPFTLF